MTERRDCDVDDIDLIILRELENNGRLSVSDLAKTLGTSRNYASKRLQRLLNQRITRVVAFTRPSAVGYRTTALVGIKAVPKRLDAVADALASLPNVFVVDLVDGRFDLMVWALFESPEELGRFLRIEVGRIPGVLSTETMTSLEMRKMAFNYLVSSSLISKDRADNEENSNQS